MNRNCIDCGSCEDTLMIGAVEGGSGPGRILYVCLPHARIHIQDSWAPQWFRESVARREAELAGQVSAE